MEEVSQEEMEAFSKAGCTFVGDAIHMAIEQTKTPPSGGAFGGGGGFGFGGGSLGGAGDRRDGGAVDEKMVLALVEKAGRETLEARDKAGRTCLHAAAERGLKEAAVKIVAVLGPESLNVRCEKGKTAIDVAMEAAPAGGSAATGGAFGSSAPAFGFGFGVGTGSGFGGGRGSNFGGASVGGVGGRGDGLSLIHI